MEIKDIIDYEGLYAISENGAVWSYPKKHGRSKRSGFWMSTNSDGCGYFFVCLQKNKVRKQLKVHRLVAEAFIPNTKKLIQVNHKDGIKSNNHVSNLEWVSAKENILHSFKIGLSYQKGEKNANSKLKISDVLEMREMNKNGVLQIDIAKKYMVSKGTVSNIIKLKTWKHV